MTPGELKTIRIILGWSQNFLGLQTGYSKQTICDFEKGYRKIPDDFESKLDSKVNIAYKRYAIKMSDIAKSRGFVKK